MDYQALKTELLAGHPGTGAYNADDQLAADELNALNISRNRTSMSGDEIFITADATEFAALSVDNRNLFMSFCGRSSIDPSATANKELVILLFGGGSTTVTDLNTARVETVSRSVELGFGNIRTGTVKFARSL